MNQKKWLQAFISATILVVIIIAGIYIYAADRQNRDETVLTDASGIATHTVVPTVTEPFPRLHIPEMGEAISLA